MATGDSLMAFDPLENRPPEAGLATLDVHGTFVTLDFDADGDESAQFYAAVPSHYRGGDVQVTLVWTSGTGASGNIQWQVELTRIAAGTNLDALPAASASDTMSVACPTTSGDVVTSPFDALTVPDLAAGDMLLVTVTRLASDTPDTMPGDAELLLVALQES